MKKKFELLGYKLEISGLVLALVAAFWQAHFSGWWDTERVEWQSWIQEEVNLSILSALNDIALLKTIDDPAKIKDASYEASQRIVKARFKAIDMRVERKGRLKEQASLFSTIGFILMFISGALIIVGKFLVYKSVKL